MERVSNKFIQHHQILQGSLQNGKIILYLWWRYKHVMMTQKIKDMTANIADITASSLYYRIYKREMIIWNTPFHIKSPLL